MIVLDANVLIAAINDRDANCRAARGLLAEIDRGIWGRALLPEYVFVEVMNHLVRRSGVPRAVAYGRTLLKHEQTEFVESSDLFEETLSIFSGQRNTSLSLVDAAVVAVAVARNARNVATFDSGFRAFRGLNIIEGPRSAA